MSQPYRERKKSQLYRSRKKVGTFFTYEERVKESWEKIMTFRQQEIDRFEMVKSTKFNSFFIIISCCDQTIPPVILRNDNFVSFFFHHKPSFTISQCRLFLLWMRKRNKISCGQLLNFKILNFWVKLAGRFFCFLLFSLKIEKIGSI